MDPHNMIPQQNRSVYPANQARTHRFKRLATHVQQSQNLPFQPHYPIKSSPAFTGNTVHHNQDINDAMALGFDTIVVAMYDSV